MNSNVYDCKRVGMLTDITALAKQMGIILNTKKGTSKSKRTLCSEINKKQDGHDWLVEGIPAGEKPKYNADAKQTMVSTTFKYFANAYMGWI